MPRLRLLVVALAVVVVVVVVAVVVAVVAAVVVVRRGRKLNELSVLQLGVPQDGGQQARGDRGVHHRCERHGGGGDGVGRGGLAS